MRARSFVIPLFAASMAMLPAATAAEAAGHSATVRVNVIGRAGKPVASTIDLVNVATGARFTVAAGKLKSVPTGTYVIGSNIVEGTKVTVTARTVVLDGATSLTFDARDGKKVTASVNQKNAKLRRIDADVAVHTPMGDLPLDLTDPIDPSEHQSVYAIPAPGGRARLSLAVTLADSTVSPSPWRFDLARTSKGIPKNLNVTAKKADLARVDLDLHTPDPDLTRRVDLVPIMGSGRMFASSTGTLTDMPSGIRAPQHLRSYRTPGLMWATTYDATGHGRGGEVFAVNPAFASGQKPYRAGHTYTETWGSGVWGTGGSDLEFTSGGKLYADAYSALCPAATAAVQPLSCSSDAQSSFRLFQGTTQLAEGEDLLLGVDTAPGWYDLQLEAARPAGATTSTAVSARWHLHVDKVTSGEEGPPLAHGSISLAAAGLDGHNAAARSSTTRITMSVDGLTATSSTALEYSTDGTTWHPLTLTKSGANWIADIPNPTAPGGVSLRANAAGVSGSTVSETITNAYVVH